MITKKAIPGHKCKFLKLNFLAYSFTKKKERSYLNLL